VVRKLIDSFKYAWGGIRTVFVQERNMRVHGVVALLAVVLGFYYRITSGEWIAILLCIGLVFILEIVNTAIETLVDLVQPNHDPLAGKVKDIAAGAVLVGAALAVIIGAIIFGKYMLNLQF
jgi:diacylglycerol kinase (ATP)